MSSPPPASVLRFEHVRVSFGGELALDDVSFDLREGETRILFGAAGSGKTVLLKTALGLVRPQSGRVHLLGQDLTEMPEQEQFAVRSQAGMLFQESALFDSLTIRDNVAYPLLNQRASGERRARRRDPERVERRVREVLQFVGLEGTLDKVPSELSGGMRRRVGIARAIATEPRLLLYDSPTAGLDPITANTIVALIIKERDTRNTTSMLVTHRYQDGHLMANFRYDPDSEDRSPDGPTRIPGLREDSRDGRGPDVRTKFMVFRQGRLVFDGSERELGLSEDPYVSKFVRPENNVYAHRR